MTRCLSLANMGSLQRAPSKTSNSKAALSRWDWFGGRQRVGAVVLKRLYRGMTIPSEI